MRKYYKENFLFIRYRHRSSSSSVGVKFKPLFKFNSSFHPIHQQSICIFFQLLLKIKDQKEKVDKCGKQTLVKWIFFTLRNVLCYWNSSLRTAINFITMHGLRENFRSFMPAFSLYVTWKRTSFFYEIFCLRFRNNKLFTEIFFQSK